VDKHSKTTMHTKQGESNVGVSNGNFLHSRQQLQSLFLLGSDVLCIVDVITNKHTEREC